MARCPVCDERKGKRQCRVRFGLVCPVCCGTIRNVEACGDCGFFRPPARDYDHLPRYSTQEMEDDETLQAISFPIEAAVCLVDRERGYTLKDDQAIGVFELLLDLYAFGDPPESVAERMRGMGCETVVEIVRRELAGQPRDKIAKVLGTVRFVACRRNDGRRAHMTVLQQFCGAFLRTGIGLRRLPDGSELAVGHLDVADRLRPRSRSS